MADESAPPDAADRTRLRERMPDIGKRRAAEETFRLSERAISWVRVLVAVSMFPLVLLVPGPGTVLWEAYLVVAAATAYSVWMLAARPYERYEFLVAPTFVSVSDAALITLFLYTTGGFASPYYLLWYVSMFALSFRYGPWKTLAGSTVYAVGYAGLAAVGGQLAGNVGPLVLRVAFIYLAGALGLLLSRVLLSQAVDKRSYQTLAADLRQTNEDLQQVSYAISHDVREPLRLIKSYLSLLENRAWEDLDEDEREFLEIASDSAERLDRMVEDLLAYNRLQRSAPEMEPVDLDDALDDALDNLALQVEETDTEVEREPLPTVHGSASQLGLLFQNLIGNAIKHAEGSVTVRVYAERDGEDWRIAVADDGPGIEEEDQEAIFQLFKQGSGSGDGEGMGLALCRRICERHGGEIDVESTPGEGTTFWMTLPTAPPEPGPDGAPAHQQL